jgi:hypothetical protein
MIFPIANLETADPKLREELIHAGTINKATLNLSTRQYFAICKTHGLEYIKAHSLALGQSRLTTAAGMLKNFTTVATKTLLSPQPTQVTDEIEQARKKICEACDEYLPTELRCSKCGCSEKPYLPNKWKWTQSRCPENKWPLIRE